MRTRTHKPASVCTGSWPAWTHTQHRRRVDGQLESGSKEHSLHKDVGSR